MGILSKIFGRKAKRLLWPKAYIDQSEGFIDISLMVLEKQKSSNEQNRISCGASINNKNIGFSIILDNKWKKQQLENAEEEFFFYWGSVTIESIGDESKQFIIELSKLYEVDLVINTMKNKIKFQAVSLGTDPNMISSTPARIKLFYEGTDEYAEVFLNIDLQNNIVQFNEKDVEYRKSIIKALIL